MDRELISRTLQNIINISHVWEYDKFSHDQLSEALRNEMLDASSDKPEAQAEIDSILAAHHDAIMNIEHNNIEEESHALFLEALRKWKRDYFL
ncbi:hypothetical protein IV49_GL000203 [Kandleria vitulina DSM 20405]|jgi:hypothetical protein|uniref:Uncharacterized protein n=1 Tax=Kandleria vitulina DSM 20405 TaxID=1410657 RepID=A0A0R2HBH6_9FIRM|nr:hypothetical protein [Kandleria vitulina]KRN50335.1 hypothetical protein IV49_GL000203 [Kandleria vitulina DSM 20405]SDL44923.1 hypothetical protein SAMN05216520_1068 [Kandleria vitulina]HAH76240.1 hypothetical protein [Kandleria vitulina]